MDIYEKTLTEGRKYEILRIGDSIDSYFYYCISDNYLKIEVFFDKPEYVIRHVNFLYDYFYTKQEERKIKLTKIYEESES